MRIQVATFDDLPVLIALMERALARTPGLGADEAEAMRALLGVDPQMVTAGRALVAELDGVAAGWGGWSGGPPAILGRAPPPPRPDMPARVRAMFTDPAFARRGVGRALLGACEEAARGAGFTRAELSATRAGELLYRACGWGEVERTLFTVGEVGVPLVTMAKQL